LADIQTAEVIGQSDAFGASQGCHSKRCLRVERVQLLRAAALLKNRRSHLFEHIDDVVAGDAVRAKTDRNSRIPDLRNPRDTMRQLSIRFRAMSQRRTLLAQK